MKCIQFQSSFPSLHLQPQQKPQLQQLKPQLQQLKPYKWLCPSSQRMLSRTRAIINPLILADASQPKGGDISVLLQTGGLLLFVYGIANFVVPAFISKQYESDEKTEEDSMSDEDGSTGDDKDGMPKPKSLGKKRGFQGTRT